MLDRVGSWLSGDGAVWVFRITLLAGMLALPLDALGLLSISTKTALFFLLSALFVFGQLFLSETRRLMRLKDESIELDWQAAVPLMNADVSNTKRVLLVARTGETFYYALRDAFLNKRQLDVHIVLTHRPDESREFTQHQEAWVKRWHALRDEMAGEINISIVICHFELQAVLLDNRVLYFGHRMGAVGDSPSLIRRIRCTGMSVQGRYLIDFVRAWVRSHLGLSSPLSPRNTLPETEVE